MLAKFSASVALVLVVAFHGNAQKMIHPLRGGDASSLPHYAQSARTFPETLKVLAVMVQFQPNNDPLTTGNGQFDTTTTIQRIIDAPPRDSSYFADHMRFAKNYFAKASNGKEIIAATVLGRVLTLSKRMRDYAPVASNLPLGTMITEAWTMADSLYPALPFQDYGLFVIFHAGSGRDIDLRAALLYDPTPYDIPSLYFSSNGLKSILPSSPLGIPLKNHPGFAITNTAVLPETENRFLPGSTGENIFFQLGINGLVVANIASHLGLPDLFDTKTGQTAIGRFGLMDGQAIFSFSGLFPPEPSAWEKMYLGWTLPITVASGTSFLRAPAGGFCPSGNDTVYKIPISAKEYFLVENRNRDAKRDGETLTIRWRGNVFTKSFAQDDDHFNAFNVDSVYGTLVDVDELDWSLPGAKDYTGGILIWHVDETLIEKNIGSNSINADPAHRGVDLEEADGSQDIGQTYGLLDPGSGSEDGSPLDFWFAKNNAPVYRNEFSETTNPNSLSNTFARSHITLSQFSDPGAVMTFRAVGGDANIALLKTIKRRNIKTDQNDAPFFADIDGNGTRELVYTSGDSIYVLRNGLTPYLNNSSGMFSPSGGKYQPALLKKFGAPADSGAIVGVHDSVIVVFRNQDVNGDGFADLLCSINVGRMITTPPVAVFVNGSSSGGVIYVGDERGYVDEVNISGATAILKPPTRVSTSPVIALTSSRTETWIAATRDSVKNSVGAAANFPGKSVRAIAQAKSSAAGRSYCAILFDDNSFVTVDPTTLSGSVACRVPGNVSGSLTLADVSGDGQADIIIGADNGMYAYNWNGTSIENFPLRTPDGGRIVGSPVVAKLLDGKSVGVLFGSSTGQVCGFDGNGKMLTGFPLQTGGLVSSLVFAGTLLAAASTDSSIYVWKMSNVLDSSNVAWNGYLADEYHSDYVGMSGTLSTRSAELLPSSLAYNWPNPVYGSSTNIRYYLSKSALVAINIYNMAGEKVDEFSGPGYANLDNEVQWDVSKVQSGVYFAQVRANANGEEQRVVIKIAVVK